MEIIRSAIARNKKTFKDYNGFRKKVFQELSPKDSEVILYALPWLLSVNHSSCPGYVKDLQNAFRVFNIANDKEIRSREDTFKRKFGIRRKGSLLRQSGKGKIIDGVYTIGSVGTVSQTSSSDCDIWICCVREAFGKAEWTMLHQKVNLIKDWMDQNLKMPVYFFVCDVDDIKMSRFGRLEGESSGSAQKNVLKEEFYRTCILICGKIPIWWVSYDRAFEIDYKKVLALAEDDILGHYDLIDFGDLEQVGKEEYLSSALWHIHKSLDNPLKSIIKITLLKVLLDSPHGLLICHQFRERVLGKEKHSIFLDPAIFSMSVILNYYTEKRDTAQVKFLKEIFYMRCRIKPYERNDTQKKKLTNALFKNFSIDIKTRIKLSKLDKWDFSDQIKLGNKLFKHLLETYRDIAKQHTASATRGDKDDLLSLGRKISACYQRKKYKIPVLPKPAGILNISHLDIILKNNIWMVFSGNDRKEPLVSNTDIVYVILFLVWNGLFDPRIISMEPNTSQVSIQEIINLGNKAGNSLGKSVIIGNEFFHYLKDDYINKLFIIISFEESPWEKNINKFSVAYTNSWGELFEHRLNSRHRLLEFLKEICSKGQKIEVDYYLQRNVRYYEKIIERTKKIVFPMDISSMFHKSFY